MIHANTLAADEKPTDSAVLEACHLLDTGSCHTMAAALMRGLPWKPLHCHCLVALLRHSRHGWILWDTGYAPRILDATHGFPWRLYRLVTPLRIQPELAIVAQLPRFGLTPDDIQVIILSHLHGDHVAGLRDFPNARLVVSRSAWEDAQARKGFSAVRRALLPALIPPDFATRAVFIDRFEDASCEPLGATHDLFGDGTLRLFPLPGHARGQMGLLFTLHSSHSTYLFAADSCMHRDSARTGALPGWPTMLIADDAQAVAPTIARLHAFVRANPDVMVVPTHCPETYRDNFGVVP